VGSVDPERVAAIVAGVAEGCRRAGCALLGGETAEHPGVMPKDAFDLAGFCVGVVGQELRLGPDRVREGDVLIGLASSGLHANGFSLVRDALLERGGYALDEIVPPLRRPLVDELLEPTAIYAPLVLGLGREGALHAAAHVTGGGIVENLPRVLPERLEADIAWGSWPEPPVFELLRAETGASEDDLRATFNLGVGMVLVVPVDRTDQVIERAEASGSTAFPIGLVRA
jgi:phosphoribosylformylglycinamidine cyclo-ligase